MSTAIPSGLPLAILLGCPTASYADADERWDKPRWVWHSARMRDQGSDGKPVVIEREDYELTTTQPRMGLQDFGYRGGCCDPEIPADVD